MNAILDDYTDEQRRAFLNALDAAPDVQVSDWEAGFLESNHDRTTFTDAQRESIDQMISRYGDIVTRW